VNSERIYLDNAATTALRPEAAAAMLESQQEYNPSSLHAEGRRARAALDGARQRIATLFGTAANEIVFTSSGTESDNLALLGIARAAGAGAHVVSTSTEHHAVLGALDRLREEGFQITVLPVGPDGRLDAGEFEAALRPNTVLASVAFANNETGTVQPIAQVASIARARGVAFHTDAVQAARWLSLMPDELGVDLITLSAHKAGGPHGAGLLYVRSKVPLAPISYGGGQESGRRSGTHNLPGILGMAAAFERAVSERDQAAPRVAALRDRLEAAICAEVPDVRINGSADRLPNFLNVSFGGVESATLLIALDLAGIAASAGSACTSGSPERSHVLRAMGMDARWQTSAIRFTLGTETSAAEIDRVAALVPSLVAGLRKPAAALRGDG
jgi:cysteine desulfurase